MLSGNQIFNNQVANIRWIIEKAKVFQKNISFCFTDDTKAFDCVDHNKLENSSRDGNTRPPYLPPDKSVCRSRAAVRTERGTMDWFQIGKGVCQGCILLSCLFNLYQSTSGEMPGWMKHKLESGLPGEISITSDMQMTPPLWQKAKKN